LYQMPKFFKTKQTESPLKDAKEAELPKQDEPNTLAALVREVELKRKLQVEIEVEREVQEKLGNKLGGMSRKKRTIVLKAAKEAELERRLQLERQGKLAEQVELKRELEVGREFSRKFGKVQNALSHVVEALCTEKDLSAAKLRYKIFNSRTLNELIDMYNLFLAIYKKKDFAPTEKLFDALHDAHLKIVEAHTSYGTQPTDPRLDQWKPDLGDSLLDTMKKAFESFQGASDRSQSDKSLTQQTKQTNQNDQFDEFIKEAGEKNLSIKNITSIEARVGSVQNSPLSQRDISSKSFIPPKPPRAITTSRSPLITPPGLNDQNGRFDDMAANIKSSRAESLQSLQKDEPTSRSPKPPRAITRSRSLPSLIVPPGWNDQNRRFDDTASAIHRSMMKASSAESLGKSQSRFPQFRRGDTEKGGAKLNQMSNRPLAQSSQSLAKDKPTSRSLPSVITPPGWNDQNPRFDATSSAIHRSIIKASSAESLGKSQSRFPQFRRGEAEKGAAKLNQMSNRPLAQSSQSLETDQLISSNRSSPPIPLTQKEQRSHQASAMSGGLQSIDIVTQNLNSIFEMIKNTNNFDGLKIEYYNQEIQGHEGKKTLLQQLVLFELLLREYPKMLPEIRGPITETIKNTYDLILQRESMNISTMEERHFYDSIKNLGQQYLRMRSSARKRFASVLRACMPRSKRNKIHPAQIESHTNTAQTSKHGNNVNSEFDNLERSSNYGSQELHPILHRPTQQHLSESQSSIRLSEGGSTDGNFARNDRNRVAFHYSHKEKLNPERKNLLRTKLDRGHRSSNHKSYLI